MFKKVQHNLISEKGNWSLAWEICYLFLSKLFKLPQIQQYKLRFNFVYEARQMVHRSQNLEYHPENQSFYSCTQNCGTN